MQDLTQALVEILVSPFPQKQPAWVSENGIKFHVETDVSAAANGQMWKALCGAMGDIFHLRFSVSAGQKCRVCEQKVADQGRGIAPSIESITASTSGGVGTDASPLEIPRYLLASEIVDKVLLQRSQP